MLQNQQQIPKAGNKIKTNHSRKQLLEWINKQAALHEKSPLVSSFNLNALKNGVFFLVILQKIIPSEAVFIKSKIKEKPVTQYDFEKNLVLMKKIIEKHNLLNNLDINEILKSKNPLEFLSWMKNLNDCQIRLSNQQLKPESQKMISPQKKFPLNSGYKTNRQSSSSKSGQKNLSQAKSNRNYSTSKTDNPFYKVKSGKNLVEIGHNQLPVLDNNRSHVVAQQSKMKKSAYMSEFDSLDDCNEALYQLALEQSIQSLKNILAKVKAKANETDSQSLTTYLNQIDQAIFGRN